MSEPVQLTTRREFIAGTLGLVALRRAKCIARVDVSSLTANDQALVAPVSGSDGAKILVVRRSATHYLALSMQCTHEGCPVNPPQNGVIACPCHGSRYDLTGRVLHGPAQYPLARYSTRYERKSGEVCVGEMI